MKVAISGPGGIARYLIDELPKQGHEIVVITRSSKAFLDELGVSQRVTDYSVEDLEMHLHDCDAVICAIKDGTPGFTPCQLALIDACKLSPKCKRFIPSVWGGNVEDVPDQPIATGNSLASILEALRSQDDIKWTCFCQGWMSDYLLPSNQRYFHDLGEYWVQDYDNKVFTLYGRGTQTVDFTSGRDTARAVAVLLNHDANDWEPFTCISGARTTWYGLWEFVKSRDPEWTLKSKSLAQSIKQLMAEEGETSLVAAMYEIMGHSEALFFPAGKVERHREKYFKGLRFRGLEELVEEAAENPGVVV